jgi:hypothetical protein
MTTEVQRDGEVPEDPAPSIFACVQKELHHKSSKASVVQSDWLPKCNMETGNDYSAAKDFTI